MNMFMMERWLVVRMMRTGDDDGNHEDRVEVMEVMGRTWTCDRPAAGWVGNSRTSSIVLVGAGPRREHSGSQDVWGQGNGNASRVPARCGY